MAVTIIEYFPLGRKSYFLTKNRFCHENSHDSCWQHHFWQQYLSICEVNLYTVKCTYLKSTAWQMLTSRYRIFSPPNVGPLFPLLSTHCLPQAITILILSHWLVLPVFELHINGIMYHTLLIHHTCIMNLLCLAYVAHYNIFDIYPYLYTH